MTHSQRVQRRRSLALSIEELNCLDRFRHGGLGGDIPGPTRSFLLARGYLETFKDGVTVTPRGRTALLCGLR